MKGFIVYLSLILLVITGCGGSSDDKGSDTHANANTAPQVISQKGSPPALTVDEDGSLTLTLDHFVVNDIDSPLEDLSLKVLPGDNYSVVGTRIKPDLNYAGILYVPILVNDGVDDSAQHTVTVSVNAVNDPPRINGLSSPIRLHRGTARTLVIDNLNITDVDSDPSQFRLVVEHGNHYSVSGYGATVVPDADYSGELSIPVKVTDGFSWSDRYNITTSVEGGVPIADTYFPYSVASGDATEDTVVVWTRLEPNRPAVRERETLFYQIWRGEAADEPGSYQRSFSLQSELHFNRFSGEHCQDIDQGQTHANELGCISSQTIEAYGGNLNGEVFETSSYRQYGFNYKKRLTNLNPGYFYYYRFIYQDDGGNYRYSKIGRTRTAPDANDDVTAKFTVISGQDYIGKYYNTYRHMQKMSIEDKVNPIDFVVHLGDYIYETTGDPSFQFSGNTRLVDFNSHSYAYLDAEEALSDPADRGAIQLGSGASAFHAARTRSDYYIIYETYKSDPIMQSIHENFPWYMVWDDHEFSDDYHDGTAQFLDYRDEFDYARKYNSERAYMEWLPVGMGLDNATGELSIPLYETFQNSDYCENTPAEEIGNAVTTCQMLTRLRNNDGTYKHKLYQNIRWGKNLEGVLTDSRTYRPAHAVIENAWSGKIVADEQQVRRALETFDGDLYAIDPTARSASGLSRYSFDDIETLMLTPYIDLNEPKYNSPFNAVNSSCPHRGKSIRDLARGQLQFQYKQALMQIQNEQANSQWRQLEQWADADGIDELAAFYADRAIPQTYEENETLLLGVEDVYLLLLGWVKRHSGLGDESGLIDSIYGILDPNTTASYALSSTSDYLFNQVIDSYIINGLFGVDTLNGSNALGVIVGQQLSQLRASIETVLSDLLDIDLSEDLYCPPIMNLPPDIIGGIQDSLQDAATLTIEVAQGEDTATGVLEAVIDYPEGLVLDAETSLTYQWRRDDQIVGDDSSTYTLSTADIGAVISVAVTYVDRYVNHQQWISPSIGPIQDASGRLPESNLWGSQLSGWMLPNELHPNYMGHKKGISLRKMGKGTVTGNSLFSSEGVGARFFLIKQVFDLYLHHLYQDNSESQDMLGSEQQQFLQNTLQQSDANWKTVFNQVSSIPIVISLSSEDSIQWSRNQIMDPFAALRGSEYDRVFDYQYYANLDSWDAFPDKRLDLLTTYDQINCSTNVDMTIRGYQDNCTDPSNDIVLISGDIHSSWVARHSSPRGLASNIYEFTGTSISSGTGVGLITNALRGSFFSMWGEFADLMLSSGVEFLENMTQLSYDIKYNNLKDNGYMYFSVNQDHYANTYFLMENLYVDQNYYDEIDRIPFDTKHFTIRDGVLHNGRPEHLPSLESIDTSLFTRDGNDYYIASDRLFEWDQTTQSFERSERPYALCNVSAGAADCVTDIDHSSHLFVNGRRYNSDHHISCATAGSDIHCSSDQALQYLFDRDGNLVAADYYAFQGGLYVRGTRTPNTLYCSEAWDYEGVLSCSTDPGVDYGTVHNPSSEDRVLVQDQYYYAVTHLPSNRSFIYDSNGQRITHAYFFYNQKLYYRAEELTADRLNQELISCNRPLSFQGPAMCVREGSTSPQRYLYLFTRNTFGYHGETIVSGSIQKTTTVFGDCPTSVDASSPPGSVGIDIYQQSSCRAYHGGSWANGTVLSPGSEPDESFEDGMCVMPTHRIELDIEQRIFRYLGSYCTLTVAGGNVYKFHVNALTPGYWLGLFNSMWPLILQVVGEVGDEVIDVANQVTAVMENAFEWLSNIGNHVSNAWDEVAGWFEQRLGVR